MNEVKVKAPTKKDIASLFSDGSEEAASQSSSAPLIILAFGEDFTGKSRFGATGPEVIGCVPLDRKTRATFERTCKELGKRYLIPKQDLVREGNMVVRGRRQELLEAKEDEKTDSEIAKIVETTKKAYRAHVNMVMEMTWALHDNPDVQVIMIDLFEQFYQDMIYAHYGRVGHIVKKIGTTGKVYKDTSDANQEIVDFINSISDKHLILTHRTKDEYFKDVKTGKMTWSGYKWLGHSCNLAIEFVKNRAWDPDSEDAKKSWHYGLNVAKSTDNVMLEGPAGQLALKDEFITFEMLQSLVLGDSNGSLFE